MKVSVLGAGPAGSTAAYYLAGAGIEVELIDKKPFPRDKPCAGGLFNPLLYEEEFPHLKGISGKNVYRAQFSSGRYSFEWASEAPLVKTVLRKDFDHFLLRKAVEAGARFLVGENLRGEIVVDATGVRSPRHYREAGICLVHDFETERDIDTVYIHPCFEGIKGYCWLFPKHGYANIGVGAYLPQRDIRTIYKRYIDHLRNRGVITVSGYPSTAKLIPFAPIDRFYSRDRLIAGDAAGFVKPANGEGIYFAMLSGRIAARTISERRDFSWYEQQCREAFGRYLHPVKFNRSRLLLRWATEKAVKIGSRDEDFSRIMVENFFRMHEYRLGAHFIRKILK